MNDLILKELSCQRITKRRFNRLFEETYGDETGRESGVISDSLTPAMARMKPGLFGQCTASIGLWLEATRNSQEDNDAKAQFRNQSRSTGRGDWPTRE